MANRKSQSTILSDHFGHITWQCGITKEGTPVHYCTKCQIVISPKGKGFEA